MAVDQLSLPLNRQSVSANPRLLGTIGMIGAPLLLITGLLVPFVTRNESVMARLLSVLGLLYLAGWAASVVGMRQLRATGDHLLARIVFFIQLLGLSLAFSLNVQEIIKPNLDPDSLLFQITDAAWPLSHLFMLIVGILVLTAKVWRGWRKITPFLCGLALPAFFGVSALAGREVGGIVFGISTTVAFMLLGYAVRTSALKE